MRHSGEGEDEYDEQGEEGQGEVFVASSTVMLVLLVGTGGSNGCARSGQHRRIRVGCGGRGR